MNEGQTQGISILYTLIIACCAYLDISWESLTLLAVLLIIDFVTGIAKVFVIDKSGLKSNRAIAGLISKLSLLFIPIVVSIAAKQAGYDFKSMTDSVITMLVLAETFSIIGNIRAINTRKEVEEIDAVSFVLNKISKMIEALLKKG